MNCWCSRYQRRRLLPTNLSRTLEIREIRHGDPEIARDAGQTGHQGVAVRTKRHLPGRISEERRSLGTSGSVSMPTKKMKCGVPLYCRKGTRRSSILTFICFPNTAWAWALPGYGMEQTNFLRSRGVKFSFSRLTRFNLAVAAGPSAGLVRSEWAACLFCRHGRWSS